MKKKTKISVYAVICLHSEGWTYLEAKESLFGAKEKMRQWKERLPGFRYKIVRAELKISPSK